MKILFHKIYTQILNTTNTHINTLNPKPPIPLSHFTHINVGPKQRNKRRSKKKKRWRSHSASDRTFFTGSPNKGQGKEKEGRNHHVSTKFQKTEIFQKMPPSCRTFSGSHWKRLVKVGVVQRNGRICKFFIPEKNINLRENPVPTNV